MKRVDGSESSEAGGYSDFGVVFACCSLLYYVVLYASSYNMLINEIMMRAGDIKNQIGAMEL